MKKEIASTHLAVGVCIRTSALYPRCIRLSIFLLGILADVAICGLFFSLEEEESLYFWENIAENIWVAFYSVLLNMPIMCVIAFAFTIPKGIMRRFESADSE